MENTGTGIEGISGFQFLRTLRLGDSNSDVRVLQEVLNLDPDTRLAETGIGSPGEETEYFGSLSRDALQRFQAKYNIVSSGSEETTGYGLVGPRTREQLNQILGK